MGKAIAVKLIQIYQQTFSVFFGGHCRFVPSCSEFTKQAIETHGLSLGSFYGFKRICRCHPFGGHGLDPVPKKESI
jgi:putative membrane protein insertion efficiency factor